MKFGVKRLIAINSGKFELAEFDLGHSVHLSAPNNRGKSTLVNALQFIYVDKLDLMHFGKRTPEDTRNHYFGQDPSYLVFECATPSGIQTMLVCGRGALQAGKFERFVYSGIYNREDYVESDGIIRSFEDLRARLADRDLTEVPPSHLWEVLSGHIVSKGKLLPRLSILTVRNYDEYRSFREVFIGLLKLKNADARMLRRLIIACHARDIGERRIDVASLYRDMFDRATRSEEDLRLTQAIAGMIDSGRELRTEIREVSVTLGSQASALWSQAAQCSSTLTHRLAAIEQGLAESGRLKFDKDRQRIAAHKVKWDAEKELELIECQKAQLEQAHRKWSACSVEMIQAMQEAAASLAREVVRQEEHIRQAGAFDHNAMRRDVANLKRQISDNRRFVDEFDRTALAYLLKADMHPAELEKAFHILHPDTLKLIVGDHIEVRSPEELIDRIRTIAAAVQKGTYQDTVVRVQLDALRGPDIRNSRVDVAAGLLLDEQRLRESEERLRVADGLELAKDELKKKQDDLTARRAALDDYAVYARAWAQRHELDAKIAATQLRATEAAEKVRILDEDVQQLDEQLAKWRDDRTDAQQCSAALQQQLSEFRSVTDRFNLPLEQSVEQPTWEPSALLDAAKELRERIRHWLDRARALDKRRSDLKRIEEKIGEESAHSRAQRIYFSDPDLVWDELEEKREALAESESSVRKQWDDLFTLLAANFEQIIIGFRNVEIAVRALNRGIKSYQVSNLKAVELSVERIRATYTAIETLASKGSIFQDGDKIEVAKHNLRNMIEGRHVIELENLFEIRIRVQENDGKWNDAKSLDDIGSTGTGITAKAMIFIQLVRAIVGNTEVGLHFYLDETGQLDDENLKATTAMAVSRGMVPITAQPGVRMESLAHPSVTVYTLAATAQGRFRIDSYQTYHARRAGKTSERAINEPNRAEVLEEPA
jgi:hypothetical protein